MACGDSLRLLAVTSSGLNLANTFRGIATTAAYEEWLALADRLTDLAQVFTDALAQVEGEATPGSFPRWNAVNEIKTRAIDGFEDLPSPWITLNLPGAIGDATAVVIDSLCVIELAQSEIVALGGTPPPVPAAPEADPDFGIGDVVAPIGGGIVLVAAAAAAVFLYQRRRRR